MTYLYLSICLSIAKIYLSVLAGIWEQKITEKKDKNGTVNNSFVMKSQF